MTSVEDDDDVVGVPSDMFFDSCYVHHDFEFGDVRQGVDALKAASTDIDLTGQIVWPGATFLAWCVAGASVATAKAVDGMGSLPLQLSGLSSRTERPHPPPLPPSPAPLLTLVAVLEVDGDARGEPRVAREAVPVLQERGPLVDVGGRVDGEGDGGEG